MHGLPVITVAAHFQKNPLIMMSHPGAGFDKSHNRPPQRMAVKSRPSDSECRLFLSDEFPAIGGVQFRSRRRGTGAGTCRRTDDEKWHEHFGN